MLRLRTLGEKGKPRMFAQPSCQPGEMAVADQVVVADPSANGQKRPWGLRVNEWWTRLALAVLKALGW